MQPKSLKIENRVLNILFMKTFSVILASVGISVASAGLYALTAETESGQKLRSFIGLSECEGASGECLPLTECGLKEPCDESSIKASCDSEPCCDEEKQTEDQNPT